MKNKILILLITIFSVFLISDRVEALTYTANDVVYTVSDYESFRDWCYFYKVKSTYGKGFITSHNGNNYYCVWGFSNTNSNLKILKNNNQVSIINLATNGWVDLYYYTYNISTDNLTSSGPSRNPTIFTIDYSNKDIYDYNNRDTVVFNSNFNNDIIEAKYSNVVYYDIKYYLNNELYDTITVESGSSHTLKNAPVYNSDTQYWSGWTYDNNIDLTNITSDITINGTISDKPIYQVKYYINNELYHTDNVIEGNNYTLISYTDYNQYTHTFSGWTYDNNIDFTNVRQNIDITSTLIEKEKTPVYIDFPIDKNDFYSLLFMLGILISMLFLKWCYPFKMGGEYK